MVYLDNAAAAPPNKKVVELFQTAAFELYPNQEAIHSAGYDIRKKIDATSKEFASCIDSKSKASVLWVNSGTEGLNCVFTHHRFDLGNIITTEAEHAALAQSIKSLKHVEVRIVRLGSDGRIDLDHFTSLLDDKTTAVAVHHVQSETGVVQDLISLRKEMDIKAPNAKFVVDTVQSVGKVYIPWNEAGIDFCFVAGHKIGCPCGGAVVYRDKNMTYSSHFSSLRSVRHSISRPEPVSVFLLSKALNLVINKQDENVERARNLSEKLRKGLAEIKLPSGSISITVDEVNASPFIVHFCIPGFQSAVLLRFLAVAGVMVSSGSACEAETKDPSKALIAMGFDRAKAFSAMRVSTWTQTTEEDVDEMLEALQTAINDY